ncbi:MAG TPA: hypothetical protein VFX51_12910 [Solirubrobacteraceae bacterium]|nr:hypothetical protein [Solirubrobacteraceae bacterium]
MTKPVMRPGAALLAASLSLVLVPSAVAAPAGGYLGVADRLQAAFEPLWDQRVGRYVVTGGGTESTANANMLLVHSVAALRGHSGPSRQDARARVLVRSLLATPPYTAKLPPRRDASSQWHAPGWVSSMHHLRSGQHVMVDSEVVDGLVYAWLARRQLGLPDDLARLIARRIHAVASGRFWRWPAIRLNQFNWYARIYSADAIVTGRATLVRRDLRRQLARFADGANNFGPGMRFHYFPHLSAHVRENFDSAEYANIVASFTRFTSRVPHGERPLFRRWLRRVLFGYWTHGGYMNWDTGLGFRRWHQSKKHALAQQALIGIASSPELAGPRMRAWAHWILDRGLSFYERQAASNDGVAPGVYFGIRVKPQSIGSARLAHARIAANAARAAAAGLSGMPEREPPPLYSFDPDTGRLAITTPAYNTAIVPVSQGAFPYGGIELARLFDGDQEVAANVGGRPPAAFGLVVRDRSGRRVLATQLPRRKLGGRPLRLTRAPAGVGASSAARGAFAGSFRDLRATGTARAGSVITRVRYRFGASFIDARWSVRGAHGHSAEVLFPSWGRHATVLAVRRDGTTFVVGRRRHALRGIDHFRVRSARTGYVITPLRRPRGASVRARRPARQASSPHPGPTLAVGILHDAARAGFAVRIRVRGA